MYRVHLPNLHLNSWKKLSTPFLGEVTVWWEAHIILVHNISFVFTHKLILSNSKRECIWLHKHLKEVCDDRYVKSNIFVVQFEYTIEKIFWNYLLKTIMWAGFLHCWSFIHWLFNIKSTRRKTLFKSIKISFQKGVCQLLWWSILSII